MIALVTACLLLAAEPGVAPPELQPPATPPAPATETASAVPTPPADSNDPLRFTASLGLGRSWPGGMVDASTPMNDLTSPMTDLRFDVGLRIVQRWMVAVVMDVGTGGTPGWPHRAACSLGGVECSTSGIRFALEGRYAFSPAAERTWWVGAGLGSEVLSVSVKGTRERPNYLPTYGGLVLPRLSCGWDSRVNRFFGWGFYGAFSTVRYDSVRMGDSKDFQDLPSDPRGHSWLDLGVRIVLLP